MIFIEHIFISSQNAADFHQIWLIYASRKGFSSLFKSRLYDLFPLNYANELLDSYVNMCIIYNVTM